MIDVSSAKLYRAALKELQLHGDSIGIRGRFVQIFLALKFHQQTLPTVASGSLVQTAVLQGMIDDVFSKASRPANDCVLVMFGGSYLARTGLLGPGNSTPQNTWRNNFNLQKGVGCYADAATLAKQSFRAQPRLKCRALIAGPSGTLAGGQCGLSTSAAKYRGEEHSKWLHIDPGGDGYSVVDPHDTGLFCPYVAPAGARLPFVPVVVALYHDAMPGLVTGTRKVVDVADFASDFNFTPSELHAYFDDSATHSANLALHFAFPGLTKHSPFVAVKSGTSHGAAVAPVVPPTPAAPPATNGGWHAEQYVEAQLRKGGWTVHNVSRQRLGFDLLAQKGTNTRYVEVKSSIGLCTPTLTMREWQQAQTHRGSYVLAILENFNSTGTNAIDWIIDPFALPASPALTQEFTIGRSSWVKACVPYSAL